MLKQITFQGVFEPAAGGRFSVYFPDLPGCASYGATLDEAQKNAQDALALHLYGMENDGDPIPAPSAAPEIDPETAPEYLECPVTVSPSLTRDELGGRRDQEHGGNAATDDRAQRTQSAQQNRRRGPRADDPEGRKRKWRGVGGALEGHTQSRGEPPPRENQETLSRGRSAGNSERSGTVPAPLPHSVKT